MASAGAGECDEDETGLITIHFLSQQEPETVVRVRQRNCERPKRHDREKPDRHRTRKEELYADAMGASPRSSMSSLISQSYSRLPDSQSNSWLNLRKMSSTLSTSETMPAEQQSQQQDFLSTLFDKLSGSLTAVSETDEATQMRDQELVTYTMYSVSTRRFNDSPSPPVVTGWAESAAAAKFHHGDDGDCDEDGAEAEAATDGAVAAAAEEGRAETPEIVRFLWAHQAKCWPGPVSNGGAGQFGHPIFSLPSPQPEPDVGSELNDSDEDEDLSMAAKASAVDFDHLAGGPRGGGGGVNGGDRSPANSPARAATAGPLRSSASLHSPTGGGDGASAAAGASDTAAAGRGNLGAVKLALDFNFKSSVFLVHVIECRDLRVGDAKRNRTDCYVKTCLLPDQTHRAKKRTKARKNSQSPIFDEKLKYCITLSDLETRKLHVSVWHSTDLLQSDQLLGELEIPISLSRLQCKDAAWYSLQQLAPSLELQLAHSKYVGEVTLSLKYVTQDNVNITNISQAASCGELRIWVKEARNLPSTRMGSQAADPYVKLCLLPDRSARGKRKTPPVQKSCSPVWNLVLKFENISVSELQNRALELTIWDNYRLLPGRKVFLGGILLQAAEDATVRAAATTVGTSTPTTRSPSPRSPSRRSSDEAKMWRTVLERHNVWVDGNLLLQGTLP